MSEEITIERKAEYAEELDSWCAEFFRRWGQSLPKLAREQARYQGFFCGVDDLNGV